MNPNTDSPLTGNIDGQEFDIESVTIDFDREIEHVPKEFEMIFSPDTYGGVWFPIPVDPLDTEPIVIAEHTSGEVVVGPEFPFEVVMDGEIVDMDVQGPDGLTRIVKAYLTIGEGIVADNQTTTKLSFQARKVERSLTHD